MSKEWEKQEEKNIYIEEKTDEYTDPSSETCTFY